MHTKSPRFRFLLPCACFLLLLSAEGSAAPEYALAQPVSVTVAGQTVQLPAGQSVSILGTSGGSAMIRVKLPDGSLSMTQVPAADIRHVQAAPASTPALLAATTAPADATAPAAAAATPAPAATENVPSQFALKKGTDSGTPQSGTIHKDWKLVWSDEFDKPEIDKSKWGFEVNGEGGGNGEMQYYTDSPKNAHVADGNLTITAIKEDYKGKHYTSARMTTHGKFSVLYGRIEARIKFPTGKGFWPAFWMMPEDSTYGGWARSGEIDIAEVIGDKPSTLFGTIHYGDKWPKNTHTGDKIMLPSGDFGSDFHVIAIEWEKGEMRWYLDDKLYQTQTKWYTASGAPFPAPFDQKFHIILNVAVGGAWPGPPARNTVFPQSMVVDYVRVYQPQ